jgi:hypothetical protein
LPSAVHSLSFNSTIQEIVLSSHTRADGTPELLSEGQKTVPITTDTDALLDRLQTILRKLPTEKHPRCDIYQKDTGIIWQSDDFTWINAAPEGCNQMESEVIVTQQDRDAFNEAVQIAETLVQQGVAERV